MEKKTIIVITRQTSDLSSLLEKVSIVHEMQPGQLVKEQLDKSDAIAILGGTHEEPIVFQPKERIWLEEQIQKGKKVFCEYCQSLGDVYSPTPVSTRAFRLVFCGEETSIEGLKKGDVLEDQCNMVTKPHDITCSHKTPILQYMDTDVHAYEPNVDNVVKSQISNRALWFDEPENLLFCSFRVTNFIRARFAPKAKWKFLIQYLIHWLTGEKISFDLIEEEYSIKPYQEGENLEQRLKSSIERAMDWFEKAEILIDEGKGGVQEGIGTEIYPDGTQRILTDIRNDCTGEVAMAYFFNYLRTKDKRNKEISERLTSLCFNQFQIKEHPYLKGMMRWSNMGWGVCYQDDVARAIIPQLLKCLYTGTKEYLGECMEALRFLIRTTGTDGTRVMRTDNKDLSPQKIQELSSKPGNYPSAHYNSFYLAALLLAYQLTGDRECREVGVKGLETIMSVYPETIREHSETQELCRLIMPLSWLYWTTHEEKHKEWLYQVVQDLQKYKHTCGAYLEWDSGYKAERNSDQRGDESSLLHQNGDPVVDLLYSLNWLPIGFMQAYFVTGDSYFVALWEQISKFMVSCQLHSKNPYINGAWARAFDVEQMEVYGIPKDLGWGPWAIESGWTMGEITSGLIMGLLQEDLKKCYDPFSTKMQK